MAGRLLGPGYRALGLASGLDSLPSLSLALDLSLEDPMGLL